MKHLVFPISFFAVMICSEITKAQTEELISKIEETRAKNIINEYSDKNNYIRYAIFIERGDRKIFELSLGEENRFYYLESSLVTGKEIRSAYNIDDLTAKIPSYSSLLKEVINFERNTLSSSFVIFSKKDKGDKDWIHLKIPFEICNTEGTACYQFHQLIFSKYSELSQQ